MTPDELQRLEHAREQIAQVASEALTRECRLGQHPAGSCRRCDVGATALDLCNYITEWINSEKGSP